MEHIIRIRAIGAAITISAAIAVSAITSTVVASRAYKGRAEQSARNTQEMTVKGSARTAVRSDLAVWNITMNGYGTELKAAYEVLEHAVDRVKSFLIEQGFDEAELSLNAITTTTHTRREKDGRETTEVAGHTLRRTFTVTSHAVDRVAKAAGEVTQLLRENVQVTSFPPEYTYSKVADLKVAILGDASKDARDRANQVASNAGCRIGEVRRASMGVIQITQPHSTEISGYGMYDTSTIEKDVSVVVNVTFAVLPP